MVRGKEIIFSFNFKRSVLRKKNQMKHVDYYNTSSSSSSKK